jgi:hypothetical protein
MTLFKRTEGTVDEMEKALETLSSHVSGGISDPKEAKRLLDGELLGRLGQASLSEPWKTYAQSTSLVCMEANESCFIPIVSASCTSDFCKLCRKLLVFIWFIT